MNDFLRIKSIIDQIEENRDLRVKGMEQLTLIVREITDNREIESRNIKILRDRYGIEVNYSHYTTDKILRITFNMTTKKVYIYEGLGNLEFKIF